MLFQPEDKKQLIEDWKPLYVNAKNKRVIKIDYSEIKGDEKRDRNGLNNAT